MASRRLPFWASFFTLLGLCLLIGLGVWQIQRLTWKEGLLTRLAQSYSQTDLTLSHRTDLLQAAPLTRVWVRGRYNHDKEALIRPRTWQGQSGYHVITPLLMDGGGQILVNRGWIPLQKEEPATRQDTRVEGTVDVYGLLREPEAPNFFTPANDPRQNIWFSINPAEIAQGDPVMGRYIIYADTEKTAYKKDAADLPVREALRWQPPNNHLGYAIFWFSMAAILLVIYYLRFWRPKRP